MSDPSGQRIPRPIIISWVIDGVLAMAILTAVYQGGTFVERLDTVISNFETLSKRVTTLEDRPMSTGTAVRLAAIEAENASRDRFLKELKEDLGKRLDKLEVKLDKALE